ncbi:hypothetical protein F5Y07DRAFT_394101 [Xylaria sp. FL0933]|nr:hypothetical protein F5Y07DRAFT_394101 [Xylaria sp. FL0933]
MHDNTASVLMFMITKTSDVLMLLIFALFCLAGLSLLASYTLTLAGWMFDLHETSLYHLGQQQQRRQWQLPTQIWFFFHSGPRESSSPKREFKALTCGDGGEQVGPYGYTDKKNV